LFIVAVVTSTFVFLMFNIRCIVNKSEAMRAMRSLGRIVLDYRKQAGALPPESYVKQVQGNVEGRARLGDLQYRAQWIGIGATDDTILAYVQKTYHSLFIGSGYVVLRLDRRVEWMDKEAFEKLLAQQQGRTEIEMLRQQSEKTF